MSYVDSVLEFVTKHNPGETVFHQAVKEVLESLRPVAESNTKYEKYAVLERLTEPERIISFRVPWVDDNGRVQINKGYRVQFNSAIGPYKGGMRFHPSVDLSIIKFLGFEQTLKNSLTGLPLGGGKGGANFDPKGKSEQEVMRFCHSLINELYKYLGPNEDIPAGDIGVGAREVGFMYGQLKKITGRYESVFTGKGIAYGGSLARTEATGFGLVYFTEEALKASGKGFDGQTVVVSGSGNVAIFAAQKAAELGAKVVAMSDSGGYIYDKNGIDLQLIKQIKVVERARISEYRKRKQESEYVDGGRIWNVPCNIALPCATQNELSLDDAKTLVKNGCYCVGEGANMPSSLDAVEFFLNNKTIFLPAKAANAGGVATSGLEMSQNAMRLSWTFSEVDEKLHAIMKNIFAMTADAAKEYNAPCNYVLGSNVAGFLKVADAMIAQGIV